VRRRLAAAAGAGCPAADPDRAAVEAGQTY